MGRVANAMPLLVYSQEKAQVPIVQEAGYPRAVLNRRGEENTSFLHQGLMPIKSCYTSTLTWTSHIHQSLYKSTCKVNTQK